MKKHISLDQLRPGMYLIGMDQSWWNTPFIIHHRLIKSEEEVIKLRQSGVKKVVIDSSKGLDVESSPETKDAMCVKIEKEEKKPVESEQFFVGISSEPRIYPEDGVICSVEPGDSIVSCSGDEQAMNPEGIVAQVRDATIQTVGRIFEGVMTGVPIDFPLLHETTESVVRNITDHARSMSQFVLLQNLQIFDKHLYSHVVDVCALSIVIGLELGWSEDQLYELGMGALLHDVGYMRLPANLVRQRYGSGQSDSPLLKQHTELGASMLQKCSDVPPAVCRLVQEHHERTDGSGSPLGLNGSEITAASKLLGLIDQFDSLTSRWGNGPQVSSAQVLRDLFTDAKAGRFDALMVERMIRCFGVYPVGSFVELSTKERGVVVMLNPDDLLKPVMKMISNEQGLPYPSPFQVDLADARQEPARTITALLDPDLEGIQVAKYMSLVGSMS